jgi:hypothetical protein
MLENKMTRLIFGLYREEVAGRLKKLNNQNAKYFCDLL